jgi:hypothetical protein
MLLQLLDAIDHPRARKRDAQRVQQRELRCFRDLVAEGFAPVDNTRPGALDACEEISREKYRLRMSSQVSRRAHPVEKQSVPDGSYCVVRMAAGIELCVSDPAAVELRKKRSEPFRMLEVNRNGFVGRHLSLRFERLQRSDAKRRLAPLQDWRREDCVLFREIDALPWRLAIADKLCRLALIALQREEVTAIAFNPSRGCPVALICKIWAGANALNRFAVDHE